MNHLNSLLHMARRLERHADRLRLNYRCETRILEYCSAETRTEDGIEYAYPEMLHLNIESWSTFKLSFRLSDGRFVREGTDLNGVGISIPAMYRRVLADLRAHAKRIALYDEAKASNCIVSGENIIVVENADADCWMHHQTVWTLIDEDGRESNWYGPSPTYAMENAYPFVGRTSRIVMIRLSTDQESA